MACLVALVFAAPSPAQPHSGPPKKPAHPATCDGRPVTDHIHRAHVLFKDAYALERWESGPKRSEIKAAQDHKACIRIERTRKQLSEYRQRRAKGLDAYAAQQRQVASLTPYPGPNGTHWAIPWYVVDCESGGDWGAYNASSSATGPYQMLPSTYAGVCETCDWGHNDQHLAASRVWARSGGSEWSCA